MAQFFGVPSSLAVLLMDLRDRSADDYTGVLILFILQHTPKPYFKHEGPIWTLNAKP